MQNESDDDTINMLPGLDKRKSSGVMTLFVISICPLVCSRIIAAAARSTRAKFAPTHECSILYTVLYPVFYTLPYSTRYLDTGVWLSVMDFEASRQTHNSPTRHNTQQIRRSHRSDSKRIHYFQFAHFFCNGARRSSFMDGA